MTFYSLLSIHFSIRKRMFRTMRDRKHRFSTSLSHVNTHLIVCIFMHYGYNSLKTVSVKELYLALELAGQRQAEGAPVSQTG